MAKAKQSQARKSATGQSTLANLASKTTTEAAEGGKVERHPNFTGQYFLDRFVVNKAEELSKLTILRQAVKVLDLDTFKKSMNDMVSQASKIDEAQGFTGKTLNKGPVYRTAQNTRSVLRKCYGALKFCEDSLSKFGYTNETGYHAFSVIAAKALEAKKINWDGTKAEDAEHKKIRLMHKREEQALRKIKENMPRQHGQSLIDYEQQCLREVNKMLEKMEIDDRQSSVKKEVDRVLNMGAPVAAAVVAELQARLKEMTKGETKAGATVH